MDRNPAVVTPDSTIREAIEKMLSQKVEGLIVIDEKSRCLGLLTLGYLLRGFLPDHLNELPRAMQDEVESVNIKAFFGVTSNLFLVADFFKEDVVPLSGQDSLMHAATQMQHQRLSLLPVVTREKLAGVISQRHIMQGFFNRSL